jgi:hypothetical protein
METWTKEHGHKDMDIRTWAWGHGQGDMETWAWGLEH